MALVVVSLQSPKPSYSLSRVNPPKSLTGRSTETFRVSQTLGRVSRIRLARTRSSALNGSDEDSNGNTVQDEEVRDLGVRAALSLLKFYKREISPVLPSSCRYVPTCSEYSMEAYKKYGVAKGTILTAWRLCRCNPLGGSGFDPPRWFDEAKPSE